MRPHFLVLLLIPIVHGHFNLFNPLRNFLPIPSVQYIQVGNKGNFDDDRHQNSFHHRDPSRLTFTTHLERCLSKNGFYIKGKCYMYISTPASFAIAIADCQTRGGTLWLPDLDDTDFYNDMVDATRSLNPDFFAAANQHVWIAIRNNLNAQGNPVNNHLHASVPGGIPDCGLLDFFSGAFALSNEEACTDDEPATNAYVCELPI